MSADFHSDFSRLVPIAKKADLCICCGDIFDYHQLPSTNNFKFPLPFYSIKGNKELWGGEKLQRKIEKYHNFYWLNDHLENLQALTGLQLYGIDHSQNQELSIIPDNIEVLISHQPAFGLADQCSDSYHATMVPNCGSKALRRLIDQHQPKLLISGHVHHYQTQKNRKTLAITLPAALTDPILILEDKKVISL
ncbi:MAG: metallophosphoesterase family protein [Candidatus Hodarchaeales archaeon]